MFFTKNNFVALCCIYKIPQNAIMILMAVDPGNFLAGILFLDLLLHSWAENLSPTMQQLLGGTMSWSIDQKFANGGEFRRVTFQLK